MCAVDHFMLGAWLCVIRASNSFLLHLSSGHHPSSDPDHFCKGPDLCLESTWFPLEVDTEQVSLLTAASNENCCTVVLLCAKAAPGKRALPCFLSVHMKSKAIGWDF